jgi:hypothetical protein
MTVAFTLLSYFRTVYGLRPAISSHKAHFQINSGSSSCQLYEVHTGAAESDDLCLKLTAEMRRMLHRSAMTDHDGL